MPQMWAPATFTVWGFTAVELLGLLGRWKAAAMGALMILMVTLLLFGDLVRLSWHAQLGIDSPFGDRTPAREFENAHEKGEPVVSPAPQILSTNAAALVRLGHDANIRQG